SADPAPSRHHTRALAGRIACGPVESSSHQPGPPETHHWSHEGLPRAPAASRVGREPGVTRTLSASIAAPVPSARVELVRRAATGDETAFERVVATQLDRSFRTARAILGNDADARD